MKSKSILLTGLRLIMHALLIGVIGGLGAVAYLWLIIIVYNFLFLGQLGFSFHETIYGPPSRWGIGVILVPMIGGVIVVWLLKNFGANERGVNEPDVIHFIHHKEGEKRYSIEITKSLASAITIGTGGSVGWEIPIVQLGSALSYLFGMIKNIPAQYRIVLLAAGSAASLAAIFNAPFTGVAFAVEILLFYFNISHLMLIAISAITGSLVSKAFFGGESLLHFTIMPTANVILYFKQLILFLPFGIAIGIAAALLVSGIRYFTFIFQKCFSNLYIRHMIGTGLVGLMLFLLMKYLGHYYIGAVKFAIVQDILEDIIKNPWLLLLIFSCKLLALCLTFGSGASGGLFAPSLVLGALLGAVCGIAFQYFIPTMHINVLYFVLAGMAGMLSSVTGAMITSLVFIFEISSSYHIALPALTTIIIGTIVRLILCPKGIYTFKLFQRDLMFSRKL